MEQKFPFECAKEKCCNRIDLKYCRGCKIVFYCSKECQRSEWSFHKRFCSKSLPLRLKACVKLALEDPDRKRETLYLSSNTLVKINHRYYRPCIFGNGQDHSDYRCVVCSNHINHKGPYSEVSSEFTYKGMKISACRCHNCIQKGRTLCESTFFEKGLHCFRSKIDKLCAFSLTSKELLLEDIFLLIQDLFIYVTDWCCIPNK
jgi:hypothetical protein